MAKDESLTLREQFANFLEGDERVFQFDVTCEPGERVRYIYGIIFPGSRALRYYARFVVARIAQYIDYSPIKVFIYRRLGMKIGKGVYISPDVILDPHFPSLITLEDNCILGWGAKLFTHEFSGSQYRTGRITIGKGAVIGGFSTVRGGVTVGEMAEVPYSGIIVRDVAPHETAKDFMRNLLKGEFDA